MNSRGKSPDEKNSSDKENDTSDEHKVTDVSKTYARKSAAAAAAAASSSVLKQKILSTKNGTLEAEGGSVKPTTNGLDVEEKPEV